MRDCVAVLDIGKTNLKLILVDEAGRLVEQWAEGNTPRPGPPYRHVDADAVWTWLLAALRTAAMRHRIRAIVPTTHGSAAALIDRDGLVLPILDYEDDPPEPVKAAYAQEAPAYAECFAPTNPAGLTLARQLFWQQTAFPEAWRRVRHILPYAQYWSWRLSGVAASEVTSLGAQTHLWNPVARRFTSLAGRRGWTALFPPLRHAGKVLGPITPDIAAATGLSPDTAVLCGIHDSSANHLRYRAAGLAGFTLMSTGTWLISFNAACPLEALDERRDAVSNTDTEGAPVACSRFMAGRELAAVLNLASPAGAAAAVQPGLEDVRAVVEAGSLALPAFSDSGGPIPGVGGRGRIVGARPAAPETAAALATLYTALMSSAALDAIRSAGDIVIDGGLVANRLYAPLVAALRPGQRVRVSASAFGTALGAAGLWLRRHGTVPPADLADVAPAAVPGLDGYARSWHAAADNAG